MSTDDTRRYKLDHAAYLYFLKFFLTENSLIGRQCRVMIAEICATTVAKDASGLLLDHVDALTDSVATKE